MISVTLPDGSVRTYPNGSTGLDVAESIGSKLAKDAVAVKVDGVFWDLTRPLEGDVNLAIITRDSDEGLEILRHDAAHVFAEAIKELYPEAQITIGPSIENGFYYDIFREETISIDDFPKIEKRMQEIVDRNETVSREVWDRDDAIALFEGMGEHYKAEIIRDLPAEEQITLYRQGEFVDLCRGPHLPSTGKLGKAFKLMKVAGAYWRGDSNNVMLQRIYGTAWSTEKQLKQYLHRLEEAEKRDHRKLGKEMDLFHLQEEAPGCIFWHQQGWEIFRKLQDYIRMRLERYDYKEINTPVMVDFSLWKKSGHADKFGENMFGVEDDNRQYAVKPMSCPCHVQVFNQGVKSYRDLPLRFAEFGYCHRNEPSGSLHGLSRVRAMTQDDGHIFCTEEQILEETKMFSELLISMYKDLGFDEKDITVKLSDRPETRAGSDEVWDKAETALKEAALASGLNFTMNPGEGAFYGPKLEFQLKDAIGRAWQCGTLQVDFVLPDRLGATYIGEDGEKHIPVMLHRAVLGSLERFMAILIEHYGGKFPLWLAPTQVVVAPITSDANEYALEVVEKMKAAGLRVESDLRNEKINYKIRELSLKKVPIICVVGAREQDDRTVALRRLGGKNQEILALDEAISTIVDEGEMPSTSKLIDGE
ncbi:MAG: threonine--tRNA ligase [Alphaproteobacteria bacterium]